MPIFSFLKKLKSSGRSNRRDDAFDEDKLSILIRGHDQKSQQSTGTPISANYALTPFSANIEHLQHFPFTNDSACTVSTDPNVFNVDDSKIISESLGGDPISLTYFFQDQCLQTLSEHGYLQIKVIRDISQGELIEVRAIKNPFEPLVIKKIAKDLFQNKVTKPDEDGINTLVEKNIIKEALLLHHCTVANKPPAPYICQYIDFFHDEKYYYLVMEHAGDITLANWVKQAFEYIEKGKLDLKHYKQMTKYILWQISALMHWLHHDMSICHLAVTMEQIILQNCNFVQNSDGTVSINDAILIKLCDFSLAEIFNSECTGVVGKNAMNSFSCNKHCFAHHSQHSAPKLFAIETYNAQKADMWSVGVIYFVVTFGKYPFALQQPKFDIGFRAIKCAELEYYLNLNNIVKYTTSEMILLLCGLLNYDEERRFDAARIIQSDYFKSYWQRYRVRITKKSLSQRERLNSPLQQKLMKDFPYYCIYR